MENETVLNLLESMGKAEYAKVFVGFDGFVDEIIHVVDKRSSAQEYTRIPTISQFAKRAAGFAGLSGNMELVTLESKLGGNGPIMANALIAQGYPTVYLGALGETDIHPLFADFAAACEKAISVCEPAHTDALEFLDGKLMFGKTTSMFTLDWDRITQRISEAELHDVISGVKLLAFTNWTMIPAMNGILKHMHGLIGRMDQRPFVFFDLADPTKRPDEDLRALFAIMADLQTVADVILGMNMNEARIISRLCDVSSDDVAQLAAEIRAVLGISVAVIHPTHGAAAANASEAVWVDGPFTESPRLTTGAGDNFNAGFCNGALQGLELTQCLLMGVSTSGYYVREAHSPNKQELVEFIRGWKFDI